jgi:hypothetical protein
VVSEWWTGGVSMEGPESRHSLARSPPSMKRQRDDIIDLTEETLDTVFSQALEVVTLARDVAARQLHPPLAFRPPFQPSLEADGAWTSPWTDGPHVYRGVNRGVSEFLSPALIGGRAYAESACGTKRRRLETPIHQALWDMVDASDMVPSPLAGHPRGHLVTNTFRYSDGSCFEKPSPSALKCHVKVDFEALVEWANTAFPPLSAGDHVEQALASYRGLVSKADHDEYKPRTLMAYVALDIWCSPMHFHLSHLLPGDTAAAFLICLANVCPPPKWSRAASRLPIDLAACFDYGLPGSGMDFPITPI